MKERDILIVLLLFFLTGVGCSKKETAVAERGSSIPDPVAGFRPDAAPPRLSAVSAGTHYDQLHKEVIDFEVKKIREGKDDIHFRRFVTDWKIDSTHRDDQKTFFSDARHLPYFIVTVDDVDTPLENLTLYYAFEREDDKKKPLSYISAEKYKFGKANQWLVILSEETAGLSLNSFSGERNFSLHLKSVDLGNHETKGIFPFRVTNLQPSLSVYKDPDYMDGKSYPAAFSPTLFWKGENLDKNLFLLRGGGSIPATLFLTKLVLENEHPFEMWVKVIFHKGRLNYSTEKRFEKRDGKNLEVMKLYSKAWSHAPVFVMVGNEKEMLSDAHVSELQFAYRLPPADLSLGAKGKTRLILYFASDFKFRDDHPAETVLQPATAPNMFIDRITIEGDLMLRAAPTGLPEAYYREEANWLDQSGRLDFEISLISNQ